MDYSPDQLASGRCFRTLNIVDELSRESRAIGVDTSLPGARVVRVLERLAEVRGYPERIVTDHRPAFTERALASSRPQARTGLPSQWHSRSQGRSEVFDYTERFYNRQRRHSPLGYLCPAKLERTPSSTNGRLTRVFTQSRQPQTSRVCAELNPVW
jgi:putative transposase